MSADSPSWILDHTPLPSPRSSRSPISPRSSRSPRSGRSTRSVLARERSPQVKIGWMRNMRNNFLAKTMNVNKEVAKMNHKKELLLTQINNSLYKRGWLTHLTDGTIIGLEYKPEPNYILYPSEMQLNKSTVKAFFPLKTSEFDRFLVFKAIIDPNDGSRTFGYEKVDIDFLQPSFLHRLNPFTSNPNVRRLYNRMKLYNNLVEKSFTKGRGKITRKRELSKRKTNNKLSKPRNKKTYKKH
jgi:hypothetical protein